MKRTFLWMALTLVLLFGATVALDTPVAAAPVSGYSGSCYWSYSNGVLAFSGNGPMENYNDTNLPPWIELTPYISQIVIYEGVTSIGDYAFSGCYGVSQLYLPQSLTRIGNAAFLMCSSLGALTIPKNVTQIELGVFGLCEQLTTLYVDAANPVYSSAGNCIIEKASGTVVAGCVGSVIPQDAWVHTIGEGAFMLHYSTSPLYVPGNITTIGEGAFFGALSSITLSEGLKTIGAYAFSESTLSYVYLPSSLNEIGEGAFMYCQNFTALTISEGVKSIGADAYFGCNFKNKINLPRSVQFIGESAFSANPDLPGFNLASDHPYFTVAGNCLIEKSSGTLITGCSESTIFSGEGVTSIGNYAFAYLDLSSIHIPEGIISIGEGAFLGCESLKSVRIPDGITSIGAYAFANCINLREFRLAGKIPSFPASSLENIPQDATVNIWYEGTLQDLGGVTPAVPKGIWHYIDNSCDTVCNDCGKNRNSFTQHTFSSNCDHTCQGCGLVVSSRPEEHTFTDVCDATCNKCDFVRKAHVYTDPCDPQCNVCGGAHEPEHYTVISTPAHTMVNCPSYPFTLGADGWYESTNKEHNSTSTFTVVMNHDCNFVVTCTYSCEVEHDFLHILLNSETVWSATGQPYEPYTKSFALKKGDVLGLSYVKDSYGSKGNDNIRFTFTCLCGDTIRVPSSQLEASCSEGVVCTGCGATVKNALDHSYSADCKETCDVCGAEHPNPAPHVYDNDCDADCNACGAERLASHQYDDACDSECDVCHTVRKAPHVYSDKADLICDECGHERPAYTPGDVDGNDKVDLEDAIYFLFHVNFPEFYPVEQPTDFNQDSKTDLEDAIYFLFHVNFPEIYPL